MRKKFDFKKNNLPDPVCRITSGAIQLAVPLNE